ncbi:MAG: TetR/AcrR family transcriptional regulator [Cyclobacteriaceae bacterium]|nr:TetR/AcrR family transcriptional regulator [Cyclobacteriaceae bacterium]
MPTKRELNAAKTKFEALEYVLNESKSKNFEDIQVVDICRHIGISKVTFFKYFTRKEDLLLYYRSILTLKIIIQLNEKKKEGMLALNLVVQQFANEYLQRPSLILGVINYFTHSLDYISPMRVKPAERALFFPETKSNEYELISLDELIEQHMLDVVFKKQSTLSANSRQLSEVFLSTLYGALVMCRMRGSEHPALFLFQVLGTVFPNIRG